MVNMTSLQKSLKQKTYVRPAIRVFFENMVQTISPISANLGGVVGWGRLETANTVSEKTALHTNFAPKNLTLA
jgi:hypothetical protein